MTKYIFITGGVVSGLGKGITAASLGKLMKARGYQVGIVKFNPYFNIDSAHLSPNHYGETFITDDGRPCDLVIGHYERILDESLTAKNDVTSGEIYRLIIDKERENFYDGTTVQVVPHITDEIKRCILRVGENSDVVIVEVGGTVGDIEAQPYMEAIRQLKSNLGKTNVAYIHVSLITYIDVSGEVKTKPTQHSVKELQNLGIQPDVIVCRSDYAIDSAGRAKLALFCNIEKDCIIESMIQPNIYDIPLMLEEEGFCSAVLKKLKLEERVADLSQLKAFSERVKQLECGEGIAGLNVGIVGENADKIDVNMSIRHALLFSGVELGVKIEIVPINTSDFNEKSFKGLNGIIISSDLTPASSGAKSKAISYALKNNMPLLMLGDAALLGLNENDENEFKVEKNSLKLGAYEIKNFKDTIMQKALGDITKKRFKSNVFISRSYFDRLKFKVSAVCEDGSVAAYEDSNHIFCLGVFFRPEFTARPQKPSKVFTAFLNSTLKK